MKTFLVCILCSTLVNMHVLPKSVQGLGCGEVYRCLCVCIAEPLDSELLGNAEHGRVMVPVEVPQSADVQPSMPVHM